MTCLVLWSDKILWQYLRIRSMTSFVISLLSQFPSLLANVPRRRQYDLIVTRQRVRTLKWKICSFLNSFCDEKSTNPRSETVLVRMSDKSHQRTTYQWRFHLERNNSQKCRPLVRQHVEVFLLLWSSVKMKISHDSQLITQNTQEYSVGSTPRRSKQYLAS